MICNRNSGSIIVKNAITKKVFKGRESEGSKSPVVIQWDFAWVPGEESEMVTKMDSLRSRRERKRVSDGRTGLGMTHPYLASTLTYVRHEIMSIEEKGASKIDEDEGSCESFAGYFKCLMISDRKKQTKKITTFMA